LPLKKEHELTTEEAIRQLIKDPQQCARCVDTYVTRSANEDAEAFAKSGEFSETLQLIGKPLAGLTIVDLGAGRGISSHAFVKAGAGRVVAIEPDPSDLVGHGAIRQLSTAARMEIIDSFGEAIPLPDQLGDVVYVRQVLHHAQNLDALVAECYRLLKPGGVFLACREHVADDEAQLKIFLEGHPVHQLAGGEHAFSEDRYVGAIKKAGFVDVKIWRQWDSVINAFPTVKTQAGLDDYFREQLRRKLGPLGAMVSNSSWVRRKYQAKLNAIRSPGRMYSFTAWKPK
jgi:SAM-dependent methyltransferase